MIHPVRVFKKESESAELKPAPGLDIDQATAHYWRGVLAPENKVSKVIPCEYPGCGENTTFYALAGGKYCPTHKEVVLRENAERYRERRKMKNRIEAARRKNKS